MILCHRGVGRDFVKLLDFGLVRRIDCQQSEELTREGLIAGTPAYMSPEQAEGRTDLDARTDVYSLGAVAYYLLTGRPPFEHHSAMQTVAAHIYAPVVPLGRFRMSIPRNLEDVVLRCLAKSPDERFSDAIRLQQAIGRCESPSVEHSRCGK